MPFDAHANFAISAVATAPAPATSGTTLIVTTGDGPKFPAVPFNATVWASGQTPTVSNAEIVRVTAKSGDTLTITRAQEASTARSVVAGDQIMAAITVKILTDLETQLAPLASPALTGNPTAPTQAPTDNTPKIATTAYVTNAVSTASTGLAPLASPAFTGNPTAPTQPGSDSTTKLATTAFVHGVSAVSMASIAAAQPYVVDSPDFHGAVGNGTTNDVAAFNSAITNAYNTAVSNGSYYAEIWLSAKTYFVSGTTINGGTTLGQALIPLPNPVPGAAPKFVLVIRSVGRGGADATTHWNQSVTQNAGAVIKSDLNQAYNATFGAASVIGGPRYEQLPTTGSTVPAFANVMLIVDGVMFLATNNANQGIMLDCSGVATMRLGNVGFSGNFTGGGLGGASYPSTTNLVGVYCPRRGNNDLVDINSMTCEGMGVCIFPSEHFHCRTLRTLSCNIGIQSLDATYMDAMSVDYWSLELCKIGLDWSQVSGTASSLESTFKIGLLDIEDNGASDSDASPFTSHVNDPNNVLGAHIMYTRLAGGSPNPQYGRNLVINGGQKVRAVNLHRPNAAPPIPSSQQSATYTFAVPDAGTVVESTSASIVTFTIPPGVFPVGTFIEVFQDGAGQVTIAGGSGVTLRSDGNKVHTAAQYATIGLRQRATNEWVLSGDLA